MRLIQALQAISQSIISPNTCSLFLHVHDKSFCLSRSLLLIHPSLTFCSLTHVPHAGSGLRGLSVRLLADALCRAAGFWPICPFQLFTPSTVRKQCTPDATAVTAEPSEPKWLPRLRALGGSWFRKWSKTRLLYANSKPIEMHKTDLTQRRRWFCLHLDVEAVTTLADTTIINHVLWGVRPKKYTFLSQRFEMQQWHMMTG